MEILGPNFIQIVLNIALVITALCVLLIIFITALRFRSDRIEEHNTTFDEATIPLIMQFLSGSISEQKALEAMREDPDESLSLLMHISTELELKKRSKLQPLFSGLIQIEEELEALKGNSTKRRIFATERLGHLDSEASTDALLEALNDEVHAIRLSAARSLAELGKTEAIEPILKALDLPNDLNHLREVEALCEYGHAAEPALLSVLDDKTGKYSNNAIIVASRVLGLLQTSQAVPALISLLKNPDAHVRLNAARVLGEIAQPEAISSVASLADDPAWEVRSKAMKAIGELHADTQLPVLSHALEDPSWWVRFSAAQALHSLGSQGINELERVMKHTENEHTREMCNQVLEEHSILDTKKIES